MNAPSFAMSRNFSAKPYDLHPVKTHPVLHRGPHFTFAPRSQKPGLVIVRRADTGVQVGAGFKRR